MGWVACHSCCCLLGATFWPHHQTQHPATVFDTHQPKYQSAKSQKYGMNQGSGKEKVSRKSWANLRLPGLQRIYQLLQKHLLQADECRRGFSALQFFENEIAKYCNTFHYSWIITLLNIAKHSQICTAVAVKSKIRTSCHSLKFHKK